MQNTAEKTVSVPNIPDIEARFLEPKNWRWHQFKVKDQIVRYGSVFPRDKIPDAVVVCLPGLGEFAEKYFELARDMVKLNLAFWVIDWPMQGKSSRPLNNPHKLHADNFDLCVEAIDRLCMDYIKPSSVHPDRGRIPMVMLGHSMGANIGLRYLLTKPETFMCASFTAPLLGIKASQFLPRPIESAISKLFCLFKKSYVWGGTDWNDLLRANTGNDIHSSDPERDNIHRAWLVSDPALRTSAPTFGWVKAAIESYGIINKKNNLKQLEIPIQIFTAGDEQLVSNSAILRASRLLPNAEHHFIPDAKHEILMEKDEYRNQFLGKFDKFIDEKVRQNDNRLTLF
ncbi:MAG: alpha/beta fold hydrolase [Alphaproteobacteria bacterium]